MFKRLWQESQVTVWGWTKVAAGTSLAAIHYVGHAVSDPGIKEALGPLQLPAYIGLGLAVIGFITLAAEAHSASGAEG